MSILQFAWGELAVYAGSLASLFAYFRAPRTTPPTGRVMIVRRAGRALCRAGVVNRTRHVPAAQAWIFFAFVMAVVWIIVLANEVGESQAQLSCEVRASLPHTVTPAPGATVGLLLSLGLFLGVSNTILGLTVLAWGNSLGDLVADVTVAKEGLPAMAIAGCFAGPMFNMLMGLGLSTTIATLREGSIDLGQDSSTVNLSFCMLLVSLVSSMIVVPLSGFRFKRPYGIVLIVVYFVFLAVTIMLQTGSLKFHFFGPDGGGH